MKLLMITRKVDKNDAQAGFVFNWVKKLSQRLDKLYVITWQKSNKGDLPDNIKIFSLPNNKFLKLLLLKFRVLGLLPRVDGVFCHQNPEYTILIAFYAKIFRKKIVCFYGHKEVNWRVRLMHFFANKVVTSSEAGFQIDSPKRKVISQGIDIDFFKPNPKKEKSEKLRIIAVGRISPIKNYETLINAVNILKDNKINLIVKIAGPVLLEKQKDYLNELEKLVKEKELNNQVQFLGGTIQTETVKLYQESDLSVNLCPTGAPDKVGFEAMACGISVLACNQSYVKNFGPYSEQLLFKEKDPEDLAHKIIALAQSNQLEEIGKFLREQVVKHHSLDNLLDKIIECF